MPIGWNHLTATPDAAAINRLRAAWSWHLPAYHTPLLFSALGDMFYEVPTGEIWWLNTGTAELSKLAEDKQEFEALLSTEAADDWFLPPLIEKLVRAGKVLTLGQCYTFVTLPIFVGGGYTVENLNPVPAHEHFGLTGELHKQIYHLKDGDQVRIRIAN
jgi:hypothetical protein